MNLFNRSRGLVAGAAVAVLIAAGFGVQAKSDEAPGKGVTVRMAGANWKSSQFPTEVYRQLLQRLGYEIPGITVMPNPDFYTAVGKGDVDLWVDTWTPLHDEFADRYEPGAEMIGYVIKGTGRQGYLIDKATVEKFGIKTLSDVKRDDVRKALDANGDGKADLVACPDAWGCERVITFQMEAYGLNPYVNTIKTDFDSAIQDAYRRYKDGKSIFFYTWTPNWPISVLVPGKDVMWIPVDETKVQKEEAPYAATMVIPDVEGCIPNPCNMGWVPNSIRPMANKQFLKNNPAAAALLKNAHMSFEDIQAQIGKATAGEDSPGDIARQAREWIKKNQDQVDEWLKKARDAA
jgi:glycine betaine/proline transport system substrate-binding protein